jgi:D-alanyl-D-alanine endopeptidase (penicillin-binding protein 7)
MSVAPALAQSVPRPTSLRKPAVQKKSSARQTTQVKKPATASRKRVPDSSIPRFKIDEKGGLVPDLRAAAAIIYNPDTQQVLWEENSQDQRSIASITKVMTAVVVLEAYPDLSQTVTIQRQDTWQASTTHLWTGDKVTTGDLLQLLLIASDNAAARALARTSQWGSLGFVERMNDKARELDLQNTYYADPSGLFATNVSSAYDMARLIAYAASDERISAIMRKPEQRIWTGRRYVLVHSTNALLQRTDLGDVDVKGGKTGFIAKSGYCFATLLGIPQFKQQVAVVVLGARSNSARFLETRNILSWLSAKAQDLFQKDGAQ